MAGCKLEYIGQNGFASLPALAHSDTIYLPVFRGANRIREGTAMIMTLLSFALTVYGFGSGLFSAIAHVLMRVFSF